MKKYTQNLTSTPNPAIIGTVTATAVTGRGNPEITGQKAAHLAVFLCPSFSAAVSRVYSVMAGLFGQRSALAGACNRFSTPFKPVAQYRGKYKRRLSNFYRNTVMNTHHTGNHAQNSTTTPLFSIFLHRQCLRLSVSRKLARRVKTSPALINLTSATSTATLTMLPHCSTRLASLIKPAQAAFNAVFFCAKLFNSSLCRIEWSTRKSGRSVYRYANFIQSGSMIGVMRSGLSHLNRVNIMNTLPMGKSAQNPPAKNFSLFNLFLHRQQIASNIPGTKALRIKRRNPVVIVKFSHMQGGVV